jgi:hypothetical protein
MNISSYYQKSPWVLLSITVIQNPLVESLTLFYYHKIILYKS